MGGIHDQWMSGLGVNMPALRQGTNAASPATPAQASPGQPADGSDPPDQGDPSGASLVNDPGFQKLIEEMEADGDEAEQTWKSQVNDGVFGFFAPEVHAQYVA